MEVLVKHDNGYRFTATCKGYTVTTGRGDDDNTDRDGMWPAQLFCASIGMCIGGYIAEYCKEQGIDFGDMTIELSRRIERYSSDKGPSGAQLSRTTRIDAKIYLGAKLSEEQEQGILEAADRCHITNSINNKMQIVCSLAEVKVDGAQE
jgi:uncharacterized OsmC-like protein